MSSALTPCGAGGEQRFQLLFSLAQRTAGRAGVSEKGFNRGRRVLVGDRDVVARTLVTTHGRSPAPGAFGYGLAHDSILPSTRSMDSEITVLGESSWIFELASCSR